MTPRLIGGGHKRYGKSPCTARQGEGWKGFDLATTLHHGDQTPRPLFLSVIAGTSLTPAINWVYKVSAKIYKYLDFSLFCNHLNIPFLILFFSYLNPYDSQKDHWDQKFQEKDSKNLICSAFVLQTYFSPKQVHFLSLLSCICLFLFKSLFMFFLKLYKIHQIIHSSVLNIVVYHFYKNFFKTFVIGTYTL